MTLPQLNHRVLKQLLLIRNVEQAFLDLFSQGKLNGTVHTCIGQELSAVAFAGQLKNSDFVFSNHRCHGHFIAYTGEWKKLLLELMGKKNGVCSGVGSSQHLQLNNFYSNGIQGGILPLGAGYALGNKLNKNGNIGVVYIGDGTLGEGIVYETLNFISKKQLPIVVVCENNRYAQSTPIEYNLAGSIALRAKAFGIEFRESSTCNSPYTVIDEAKETLDYVRETGKPVFHLVNTYRLKAHSKGDDDRDLEEINQYLEKDILSIIEREDKEYFDKENEKVNTQVWDFINEVINEEELTIQEYYTEEKDPVNSGYSPLIVSDNRQIKDANDAFKELLANEKVVFLGEDIIDPYGGAFKVSKGLSTLYPERVIGTSISEGLIAGVSNGLALNGFKPFAEFMFGDFTALAFDQFLNHAAKVHNMYNKKITCPVVFRTPMGGKRGYGPTHSQSIEKHFIGMDTFEILALNKYQNPKIIYTYAYERIHPTLIIENKVDYGKKPSLHLPEGYVALQSNEKLPNILIKPENSANVTLTIITYGGTSEIAVELLNEMFENCDELVQVLILSKIDPLPKSFILENLTEDMGVITMEEGIGRGTVGDTIISFIAQHKKLKYFHTINSLDITIPSVKSLEDQVLVNKEMLLSKIKQ